MPMPSLLDLRDSPVIDLPMPSFFESPRKCIVALEKVDLCGRFFFRNDEKFFLKGVTYGPFFFSCLGVPFLSVSIVEIDFVLMRELGVNCFRIFMPPPKWLFDMAVSHGLR